MKSAGGASAYSMSDDFPTQPLCESGTLVASGESIGSDPWAQRIDELLRIRGLEDDWDGEGTEAPDHALVDGAITLALKLRANAYHPADRVIAGVNGTVIFEWFTHGGYVEVEVTSPVDVEIRRVEKQATATHALGHTTCR